MRNINLSKQHVKKCIENKNFDVLKQLLANNPNLANIRITIPFNSVSRATAHPLHRICDAVNIGKITDEDAVKFAKIFLANGAHIDGDKINGDGTPLLAAASLHAEKVGVFYIENGADIHYTYKNDGVSPLHWASYCGLHKLVEKLIISNASINQLDTTYKSTPLSWAIHYLQMNAITKPRNQMDCIKLLLNNGADTKKLSKEKSDYLIALAHNDRELKHILTRLDILDL